VFLFYISTIRITICSHVEVVDNKAALESTEIRTIQIILIMEILAVETLAE
jgi:hypothetical protein